jgi:predicted Zn-dependent peptidase
MTATLPGTGFAVDRLDNGLRVLSAQRPGDTMCAMLFVTAGSRYERRENSGVAHMLEHLFFSGTPRRPSLRVIAGEIDGWGCRFNALTDQEYTAYYIHGAAGYTEPAVELIADLIHHAVLPPADIERERQVIFTELRTRQDNQRQRSRQLANLALYGDAPMGWDTVGFPDVLERLDRDALMAFRAGLYQPARMILSVAGPVPHERVLSLAQRHFSADPGGGVAVPEPEPAGYAPPTNIAAHRDSRLAHLWLSAPGPAYADPERDMMAARLMNAVLGTSMSSRLFTSVREQKGLCYSIRSTLDPCSDVGAFLVATGVAPGKAARLVESVVEEMVRLAEDGPTEAEMAKARAIVKGTSALDREDAAALARLSAFELMHRGFVRTRAERDALADALDPAEVTTAAKRHLNPAHLHCGVVGPPEVVANLAAADCLPSHEWRVVE